MQDIRKSPEYQRWRREVRHRDENTCRICTVQRNLHVHHIKPLEKYTEFATDLDNGITLCGNCHAFLSGKEENTNLQTITEAFTGQQDMRTAEQLKRLNSKFSAYLGDLLKSEDQDAVNNAVHKMFVHLQIYPDSFDQFLHLIEYILSNEKGFENQFVRQIAIETLKNHSNKTASEIISKYETSWNYQDGKRAYLQGDYTTALEKFEPLAESGHTESQHYLGVIYEEGRGVAKDAKAAIKWYLKAAQQGNTDAHTRLERICAKRRDAPKKDEDALQETAITRQSFFQRLSSRGISLCLSALETYDVRIEIKDSRFTLLDVERSSGSPVSGSSGVSAPLNTIFDEKLETESDPSEAYSQLSGEVFLTQEDIPILRAFLAGIKADVFVNAPTVFARVKEKLDVAKKIYYEAHNELTEFQAQTARLWNKEIELWRDEIELEGNKWDRKVLNRKISDGEIIDYLKRELSFQTHPEDIIYDYNQKIDGFLEALHQLEERTRIENTWQPKEDSELDELLRESRLCECNVCQIIRDELNELLRESGWTHEDDEEVQKLNFTKQIEKLNEHPINQHAKEILEELAPTYYELNQELRPKITEDKKNIDIEYGISPWWGLDVIILLEWVEWAETHSPIHLENKVGILQIPKTELGWEEMYEETLPTMFEISYHLRWLAEPLWEPDQQPKDVLDRLCGKHRPVCQELEQTRENFRKLYGDEAVQVSQGSLSEDIVTFLTEPDPEEAVNTLKRLLRTAATGMWQRYSPIFYPYM